MTDTLEKDPCTLIRERDWWEHHAGVAATAERNAIAQWLDLLATRHAGTFTGDVLAEVASDVGDGYHLLHHETHTRLQSMLADHRQRVRGDEGVNLVDVNWRGNHAHKPSEDWRVLL